MGVIVVRGHYTGGAEITEKHETAERVQVDDNGHLFVRAAPSAGKPGKALAVYAPKSWASARLTPETS